MQRRFLKLSIFNFEISLKPGRIYVIADKLSGLLQEDNYADQKYDYHDNVVAAIEEVKSEVNSTLDSEKE